VTKFTSKEILSGKTNTKSPFEVNKCDEDYLNKYRDNLKIIHDIVKTRIENEKIKRKKQNFILPKEKPNKVKMKVNKRNI